MEKASARVTIVVATRDRGPLLDEALASVRAQTFEDWECVVVDDGSTDDTPERLRSWTRRDPRIRALRLPPTGSHGQVRNAGLRASTAPLVAFLDDDDLWLPATLARQVGALEADPGAALVFGRMERFGDGTGIWPRRPAPPRVDLARLLRGSMIPLSTVLARRGVLEAAGLFPGEYRCIPDYALWVRVARSHVLRALPDVLCRYRVHAGGMSRDRTLEIDELERLYRVVETEWGVSARLLAPARRGLARARARRARSLGEWLRQRARSLWP